MENAAERARKALDGLVYLPSLKGQTGKSDLRTDGLDKGNGFIDKIASNLPSSSLPANAGCDVPA